LEGPMKLGERWHRLCKVNPSSDQELINPVAAKKYLNSEQGVLGTLVFSMVLSVASTQLVKLKLQKSWLLKSVQADSSQPGGTKYMINVVDSPV
jgi:hypothetical protein